MSKHIEIKVINEGQSVKVYTFHRRYPGGGKMPLDQRQWTVSREEFERALNDAQIEIPWKGLL